MLYVLFAAVLPALALLYFIYRKDDLRTEPPKQIIRAFVLGMVSALVSMLISTPLLLFGFYPEEPTTVGGHFAHAFFGAGFPEELAKLLLLMWFLRKNPDFDEWVDGIVYAASLGLGFAALENVFYLFDNLNEWLSVGIMRAFMSIPAHFFFAIIMGYFFAFAKFRHRQKHLYLILAFICPAILHGIYDFILMYANLIQTSNTATAAFLNLGFFIFFIFIWKLAIKRVNRMVGR